MNDTVSDLGAQGNSGTVIVADASPVENSKQAKPLPAVLGMFQELERNASLAKYTHFRAARRKRLLGSSIGIPVITINLLLGSLMFVLLTRELPSAAKWAGAFLSLIAAALSGVQTFFGFHRQFEGHTRTGNRYLHFSRKCQLLLARFNDRLLSENEFAAHIEVLEKEYVQLNTDAEPYPTTRRDFISALKLERLRQTGLQQRYGTAVSVDGEDTIGEAQEAFKGVAKRKPSIQKR